jgi:hypothetical protein
VIVIKDTKVQSGRGQMHHGESPPLVTGEILGIAVVVVVVTVGVRRGGRLTVTWEVELSTTTLVPIIMHMAVNNNSNDNNKKKKMPVGVDRCPITTIDRQVMTNSVIVLHQTQGLHPKVLDDTSTLHGSQRRVLIDTMIKRNRCLNPLALLEPPCQCQCQCHKDNG